ncbi:MAG: MBL fold metallo-hydrolase [Burkholderiales bacterium]|jgi:alkyl sulfatase BDS1-like metallo-beta-lactamase superfamily hydrolase|nr:MBL fold metallo-hydrolase [Burkholderiales bacterium]
MMKTYNMAKWFFVVCGCLGVAVAHAVAHAVEQPKEATQITSDLHREAYTRLPDSGALPGTRDLENAQRGMYENLVLPVVTNRDGTKTIWDVSPYEFLTDLYKEAPFTVHPSLWRQSQLVMQGGLFKLRDRLYQVRNLDVGNMTIIEGNTGLIIIDPLTLEETARAALELYYQGVGQRKPVVAVIYSHSHVDHYGGVRGVMPTNPFAQRNVRIIAPDGFLEAAVTENVLAGNAMQRRAIYMYGNTLPPSEKGHVGSGLGLNPPTGGTVTLIAPTDIVVKNAASSGSNSGLREIQEKTPENIDGLTFHFFLTPNTEAPAEMHWYTEELRALSAAENCTKTLHNVYTLRGAKTRDALAWSKALDETLRLWGDKSDIMYGMHHWPVFTNAEVKASLAAARDGYRFIHDQTLRLANSGLNKEEIAARLVFPPEIEGIWELHGYYGSLSHNARGVYTFYFGWFDGNPVNLNPLPMAERARRHLDWMGGPKQVLKNAELAFQRGEYRWLVEVLNYIIVSAAHDENIRKNYDSKARSISADAMEQLGYQAENATWRNFYLTGAQELRHGKAISPQSNEPSWDTLLAMPTPMLLDFMGVRLEAERAYGKTIGLNFILQRDNQEEAYSVTLQNSVINNRAEHLRNADVTLEVNAQTLAALITGMVSYPQACGAEHNAGVPVLCRVVRGNAAKAEELFSLLAPPFPTNFPIVAPNRED